MIIDGVLIGVGLATLELGIAWILACVMNHESPPEKKEGKDTGLKFLTNFANVANIK